MIKINKKELGQLFMVGLPGADIDPETVRFMRETAIGNFILFQRNTKEGAAQLKKLTNGIKRICKEEGLPPPLIAVDQEGGRVQRLGPFHPHWKRIKSNKEAGLSSNPIKEANQQACEAARMLIAAGISVNFAPVLDISKKDENLALKKRCYGPVPEIVALLGREYIRALQKQGIAATAKHFPGIGRIPKDPHEERPVVRATKPVIFHEMHPFQAAIRGGVKMIMTSHVIFKCLDGAPVTFSSFICRHILREELKFNGVLVTDDLEMGGITKYLPPADAALAAAAAGHDLLLFCSDQRAAYNAFSKINSIFSEKKELTLSLKKSIKRIKQLKSELFSMLERG